MNFPLITLCLAAISAFAADEIYLWPDGAPGSEGKTQPEVVETDAQGERRVTSIHKPSITPFLPAKDKAVGTAVLVIPGGGHRMLCVDHEGANLARWLAERGIAAFVLEHRLAREKDSTYTIMDHAVPDTERAFRLIRSRAKEWGINPDQLGGIGFSAGGELVAQASMRPGTGQADSADPIERESSRPAFQALIYPGRTVDVQPTKDSPPAFLSCSANDRKDISEGLTEAYLRFKRIGASAELHIYASGGHGYGVRASTKGPLAGWPDRFTEWLESKKFLTRQH